MALASATLLPGGSEAYLLWLAKAPESHLGLLWLIATLGNTLGSVVNYSLGRYFLHWQDRDWFPIKAHALAKAQSSFQRWGYWSLLLAWAPIIGDALTLLAGVLRLSFGRFLLLVTLAKGFRYALLLGALQLFI